MDKTRGVRRGASRFSPAKRHIKQSGHKLLSDLDGGGGNGVFIEKSKKERLRRLSAVVKASSSYEYHEMGCVGSDVDDELRPQAPSPSSSSKKFKLPKRFFDDCNSVDHSSVPRKLRSAMKKRNGESISPSLPDSKKLNHAINGVEAPRKDGVKKSKPNTKQGSSDWSLRQANSGPITKEEEEVVETLYALAGIVPNNGMTDKKNLEGGFSEAKPSTLPAAGESSTSAFEVLKDNSDSICPTTIAEVANPSSNVERSLPGETAKVNSLNEPCLLEQPNLADRKQFNMELDSSVAKVNLQTMPLLCKSEPSDEKPSCNFVIFGVPSELSLETRLKQPKQQEAPNFERKPQIALGPATAVGSQQEQQHTVKENKINGLALWPGLSSAGSHGAGIYGPSLQSFAAKTPARLDTSTFAARPGSSENGASIGKVPRVAVHRKSWKRCAAHVYISHLIRLSQISERKDQLPIQPNQLRPNEGLKQGVFMVANNLNEVRNGLNEELSAGIVGGSAAEKNSNEATNGVLMHKKLHQNQQRAAPESTGCTSPKPSFDFLSLSAGGGGVEEASSSTNRAGNGLEQLSHLPTPYLHSLAQHHTLVPLSLPQTCYTSSPHNDRLSAAAAAATAAAHQVQLQLPPFLSSPFCGPSHMSLPASTKQLQQQLQQQRFWATQLVTQYRPGGTSSPMAQFPSWQSGRQDSPLLAQYAQALLPPSSLEVLGPNYIQISQQPPQLMAITSSLPPASSGVIMKAAPMVKRQHPHPPSGYEENGGGFRSDGMLPLQLLCNGHL